MPAAGRQRPEKLNGLNLRKLRKNFFQTLEIRQAHWTSTPLAIVDILFHPLQKPFT